MKNPEYKWNKFGEGEVYEGENAIIAGNEEFGYAVYGDKRRLEIHSDASIKDLEVNMHSGNYKTKAEALAVFRRIENGLNKEGVTVISIDKKNAGANGIEAGLLTFDNKKGAVIIHEKGDDVALAHELAHLEIGHGHVKRRPGYPGEMKAIAVQMQILKGANKWNKKSREATIENVSGYANGNKKRARKDIRKLEAKLGLI